jgi:CubicO group peptidase (beta-lactamase class C family)
MFRQVSFVVTAMILCMPVYAQDKASEIDTIFSSATAAMPGCTVAVSQHGKMVVNRSYGSADLERDVPMSPNSLFDIGSVRKQFVAAAVLLLVEDGRLSLSDDIRKHFPELPDYGHKITVDNLLTHTSGIRDWTGLRPLAGVNADVVSLILRQRGLNFAPGEEWSYSNSGYVLLTELVGRVSGMSFTDFTRKRLFEPLGMKATISPFDLRDVIKSRALGYEKEGNGWQIGMYVGNERGRSGGAILSTASDLLIWNEALTSGRLGKFVTEKLQEQTTLNNGRRLTYARGLFVDTGRGDRVVWHSGSAAGYSAWLGRLPAHGLSVAVLCNADVTSASNLARRVADLFVPATTANGAAASKPAVVAGAGVAGLDVSSKAGLFFSEDTGEPLRLGVDNGQGGPSLDALNKYRFRNPRGALSFMSQDEFELHFISNDQIELKSMEGRTTRYRRALPYGPNATELQAFAGRFANDETRATFGIESGKSGLMVRVNDSQTFEFKPVDRDTFQLGGMILRFRRDKTGKVEGLDYSNPVVRNIEFTPMSDAANRR